MFKSLWNSLTGNKQEQDAAPRFDRAKVQMLIDYFPIGKKPRYYPEYQREIVFHTIVLAYRVNDQYLYSREVFLKDEDGRLNAFLMPNNKILPFEKLEKLQMLMPDTTEMEKKLDYMTRAEIGRTGQFGIGNSITLVAESIGRGVPTVDTRVERRQVLPDGPYANTSTILLTPDMATVELADKRKRSRVQAQGLVYASLFLEDGEPPFGCVLGDISDASLRLGVIQKGHVMPPLTVKQAVIVEFNFGDVASAFRIGGQVFRREDDFCVINLDRIYRDGEFEKIKAMDVLEIKSDMLNRYS